MPTTDEQAIKEVLGTYLRSLNESDAKLAASVYAPDGVFMPNDIPTSANEGVYGAYVHIFNTIKLDMVFHYDDISVSGDVAVVRTHSEGTLTVLAEGVANQEEENRELFVLKRSEGDWKITNYMFNKAA